MRTVETMERQAVIASLGQIAGVAAAASTCVSDGDWSKALRKVRHLYDLIADVEPVVVETARRKEKR